MNVKLDPASTIVRRLGGPRIVSEVTGVFRTRVYDWMKPKERGGTGGTIPQRHILKLLNYARSRDIALTPGEFLPVSSPPTVAKPAGHLAPARAAGAPSSSEPR
jgi:hypothetical protein